MPRVGFRHSEETKKLLSEKTKAHHLKTGTPDFLRFMKNVQITTSCWIWLAGTKGTNESKYGQFKSKHAHRWLWQHINGQVPPNHSLHHLIPEGICSSTLCVNPKHLQLITKADHARLHIWNSDQQRENAYKRWRKK